MINITKPAAFEYFFDYISMASTSPALDLQNRGPFLPAIVPKTLLLPGNEEIALPVPEPLALRPILPPIIEPPRTPRTPRRHLTIQELLQSPIRRTTRKRGKKECTRDDRLRIQAYYDAGLTVRQILEKLPDLTKRQVYYALQNRVTPQWKAR